MLEKDVEGYPDSWKDGFKVMLSTTLPYKPRALLSCSALAAQPSPALKQDASYFLFRVDTLVKTNLLR